ncbi:uncharacterized protein BO87DRAFT_2051 [Aspergillus neoniger CBS 115656]|uniref:Uncharacterized protein n=1 Tax=Aspergillus neoniger (strain CBS 115656) TaxID=1448310 RepID=A0A318ZVF8_ASPNB|nr:hypothetical protein BO87DRAFT_2051 [Aspergillus neoniger CBS 115656]PYH39552.1 hypothetical protein BO87DRAFT_2051 [Aspergillus neoniger CBS 115656]
MDGPDTQKIVTGSGDEETRRQDVYVDRGVQMRGCFRINQRKTALVLEVNESRRRKQWCIEIDEGMTEVCGYRIKWQPRIINSGERRPRHCSFDDRMTVKKSEYEDQGSEQHWDESPFIVDWGKTGRTQAGHPPLSHYTAGSRQYETDLKTRWFSNRWSILEPSEGNTPIIA